MFLRGNKSRLGPVLLFLSIQVLTKDKYLHAPLPPLSPSKKSRSSPRLCIFIFFHFSLSCCLLATTIFHLFFFLLLLAFLAAS